MEILFDLLLFGFYLFLSILYFRRIEIRNLRIIAGLFILYNVLAILYSFGILETITRNIAFVIYALCTLLALVHWIRKRELSKFFRVVSILYLSVLFILLMLTVLQMPAYQAVMLFLGIPLLAIVLYFVFSGTITHYDEIRILELVSIRLLIGLISVLTEIQLPPSLQSVI